MTIVTVEATPREQLIADLRALAAWLEEHPALPVGPYPQVEVTYIARGEDADAQLAEVDRIAEACDVEPADVYGPHARHHGATVRIAPTAAYRAVALIPTTESEA